MGARLQGLSCLRKPTLSPTPGRDFRWVWKSRVETICLRISKAALHSFQLPELLCKGPVWFGFPIHCVTWFLSLETCKFFPCAKCSEIPPWYTLVGFIIIPLVDICKLDSCVLQFWGVFLNDFFDYFLPSLFSVLLLEPLTQILFFFSVFSPVFQLCVFLSDFSILSSNLSVVFYILLPYF